MVRRSSLKNEVFEVSFRGSSLPRRDKQPIQRRGSGVIRPSSNWHRVMLRLVRSLVPLAHLVLEAWLVCSPCMELSCGKIVGIILTIT